MGGYVMISSLKSLTSYFPRNVLEELSKDLKGKKFRLHLVNKKSKHDLTLICSARDIVKLDRNKREVYNLKDTEITIYSGNLECGDYYIKSIVDDSSSKGKLLDYEKIPPRIGWGNIIFLKKGVVSDYYKNYFNHNFINVYAIV